MHTILRSNPARFAHARTPTVTVRAVRAAITRRCASTTTGVLRHASSVLRTSLVPHGPRITRKHLSVPFLARTQQREYASDSYPPHTLLTMPALSPTMTQGNLGQWHKKIGDEVQPGDVLVEVETDKATMDFECQDEGFLARIFIESGEKDVPVSKPLAILVENKDDVEKFADFKPEGAAAPPPPSKQTEEPTPPKDEPSKAPESPPSPSGESSDRVSASPVAKKLAAERGIELSTIKGSGPGGRIIKEDVVNYKAPAAAPAATPAPAPTGKAAPQAPAPGAAYVDIPLSNVRKVIATRLLESKQQIPHYYLTSEINADKILKLREVLNSQANGKFKLSVNDFIVKAASLALKDVPEVNSSWQGNFIRQFNSADIAVAVATENGLITPIIHQAETKGLAKISNGIKELAQRARVNKLQPHEYQGGTFTISNLGMYGISHFTAIINPPHASILAVGGVDEKLVLDETSEKGFAVRKVLKVTMSNDHRVVDGAVGARWLEKFKTYIENPLSMLL
ncbi:dihydrolipoyllysine-residue acetyltransferase [Spizellomyces sp. 'palustris']|nr:dihydrolipoyllysine-residue acetyltransferase [Spizellomyces sp. 'palustris']